MANEETKKTTAAKAASGSKTAGAKTTGGKASAAKTTASKASAAKKPTASKTTVAKASATKSAAAKTAASKTTATKATGTKTAAAKTTTTKTAASKTTAAKATGTKATAAKTAAKKTGTQKTTVSRTSKPKAPATEEIKVETPVEDVEVMEAAAQGAVVTEPALETVEVSATVETVEEIPAEAEETSAPAEVSEEVPAAETEAEEPEALAEEVPAQGQESSSAQTEEPASETTEAPVDAPVPETKGSKAGRIVGKVFACIGWGILTLLVVAAGWLAVDKLIFKHTIPQAFGVSMLKVSTGSMEGEQKDSFDAGDVIFVWRHPDVDDLEEGDIITFYEDRNKDGKLDPTPTTHRIYKVNEDGTFTTWGDANNAPDSTPVEGKNVIGQYLFHIPKAGAFFDWLSTGGGALYLVAFGAIIIAMIYVAKKKDL